MKILQINAISDSGSTGRTCQEMNKAFRAMGHDAVVAFSVGVVTDHSQEYKIGNHLGQQLHALFSRITGLQGYYSYGGTKKLLKFMDEYHPDVVILRNLHANYIHVPMLLKYLAKKDIPTVAVLHDCWLYTGKCCHYTVAGCYRWQEGCGKCPAKKKYNISWFFDRSAKMLRDKKRLFQKIPRLAVVAVSQWGLREARKAPVLENAVKMQQIYNWIDTEKFAPGDGSAIRQELGIRDEKVVLSITNAWSESKGLNTVLSVAKQLRENEKYIVVGSLPANTVLPDNVIVMPRTDDIEHLVQLYSMADVFLQTSLEETFGKVAAEALSCGTPVVCFDSTANPELVGSGCGAVVPAGNVAAMVSEMRKILEQGKQSYTDACRTFALKKFSMETIFQQYLQLFVSLQKSHKSCMEERKPMKVLWVVNMVLPDAANALGIKTSFSGSWLVDPLKMLSEDPNVELATVTYGYVEKPQIIVVNGVKHYIFPGAGKRLLFNSPKTVEDCRFVLEDFKPELIHIYGTEYAVGYSMLKLNPDVPVLLTIQGILTYIGKEYRGRLPWYTYYTMVTARQILKLKVPFFTELLYRYNARRERWVIKNVKHISGRTDHDREFITKINPNAQYHRINYNLREEFYYAEKWDQDQCIPFTIFTGAATYSLKGLHKLVKALAIVKERYPQVKLQVPGGSVNYRECNGYERYLRRQIKKLDLTENVEFIGRKTPQEMVQCLQKANVYVFPSAYDTDSLSLCEAQLIGTPIVAAQTGGSPYLVEDGCSGLCYDYEDHQKMAEQICQLFENKTLCRQISKNQIERAEQRHDREKNVQDQLRLYKMLTGYPD